jgi:hypothetical protein
MSHTTHTLTQQELLLSGYLDEGNIQVVDEFTLFGHRIYEEEVEDYYRDQLGPEVMNYRDVRPTRYPASPFEVSLEEWDQMNQEAQLELIEEIQEARFAKLFKQDSEEDLEEWVDPAGGTHYGNEDPTKMYE